MTTHERRFSPSQAHKLDAPERRAWLPVEPILASLQLSPGMTVADLGVGTGYFALPIARLIDPGKVLAVDVAPEMLTILEAKLAQSDLSNVHCILGESLATNLPAASCDLILMANVWHEFDDHAAVLVEAARVLKPAGRIAILDWATDVNPLNDPQPGPPLAHRIAKQAVCDQLAASGWTTLAPHRAGTYAYLVQASRPALPKG